MTRWSAGATGSLLTASREAQELAARYEAIVTDHWYTAKAMAGLSPEREVASSTAGRPSCSGTPAANVLA